MNKVYYAHSTLIYGSKLEKMNIDKLSELFSDDESAIIINPATYDQNRTKELIMKDCYDAISQCDCLVFSCVDNMIGLGVYNELMHAMELDIDIYVISALSLTKFTNNYTINICAINRSMWAKVTKIRNIYE